MNNDSDESCDLNMDDEDEEEDNDSDVEQNSLLVAYFSACLIVACYLEISP